MCVRIRDEQELLAFMNEARGILREPTLYLPKPARAFMKRYVAGGVFLAHSGALLIHTATKDIDPVKKNADWERICCYGAANYPLRPRQIRGRRKVFR